jgi:transposase
MRIELSPTDAAALDAVTRCQTTEARVYRRARMVQLSAAGASISSIARSTGTNRSRVGAWLSRFGKSGLDGLGDLPRTGRPPELTPLKRHQVVATACQAPEDFGFERALWSHATLVSAVLSAGLVRSISASTLGRIHEDAEIKPHRVKMWFHSKDPAFQEKMRAIVDLYVDPPKGEPVLCVDEKTGMQALSRSRDLQRAVPGRPARLEFEYKRNGTRCLFACFNVGTGNVLGRITTHRKRPDFLAFMDRVASAYRQRRVHVVLDNLTTHRDTTKGDFVTQWNRRHGNRFVFHYTPTHGSWLNQVELWFGILSRRILRHGIFGSPNDLIAAIVRFIAEWNTGEAHPFRWTYDGLPLVTGET